MAARSTMATLITKVRALTNAGSSDFTDEAVQAFLDRHRVEFRYADLCAIETRAAGGVFVYKTFELERFKPRMIEGNDGDDTDQCLLFDNNYNPLTPATSDLVNGRWVFAAEPTRPVRIQCWAYDVYAAAVDLLEQWASTLRTAQSQSLKSVTDNGQTFEWRDNDQATSLSGLADTFRARMCVETSTIYDADSY